MNVQRYIPPASHPLHPYLDSIWCVRAIGDYSQETILPKGNVDILFNLGGRLKVDGGARYAMSSFGNTAYLSGLQTGALISQPLGDVLLLGISLKAETCGAILPLPAKEITDNAIEAALVFDNARELVDRLQDAPSFAVRRDILLAWLIRRIEPDSRAEMIRHACLSLAAAPESATVDRVASTIDISSRHLRRLFLEHIGIGPTQYLRLSRFVRALHLMPSARTLTEVAHEAHYFDQAHFSRDFREIAGMTPRQYRERVGFVTGHLFAE